MSAVAAVSESVPADVKTPERVGWNPLTRVAFRFCLLYFGLFCLVYPQPVNVFLGPALKWVPEAIQFQTDMLESPLRWVGKAVFGVEAELHATGSGDQTIFWVQLFCLLVIALTGTLLWSVVSRRREHRRLAGWFLLFIRLCVAGQMFFYGFAKLIPVQMWMPGLATLLEPYGNLTPMAVLWNQVGGSPSYQILLGAAEVGAGVLLFIPRTALAGAMLSTIAMAQVFVLDMNFDVPVKILSGHLMLMGFILMAPEARRLMDLLVLNRTASPSTAPYPFRTSRSRWLAAAVQVLLGVWVGAGCLNESLALYREEGSARPKPPLYGIWTVQEFTRDGQLVPPLLSDETRWQRVVFDAPEIMEFQRMDGTFAPVQVRVDTQARRLDLRQAPGPAPFRPTPAQMPDIRGSFTYDQPSADRLRLDGDLDGHPVVITFTRLDPDTLPQRSHPFSWVMDHPNF
ncbi:DoxX family protein [Nocardia sp. CDC159]|uniref:DoxX family protein n=1 Tax=Nocardia pulmonis TaxID=2951408 RepID=A0A9X2E4K6_9NOCA|nr:MULTISPECIES: DoxX family protein [Nocardia]MCM6774032.1 DoxX family protein [Nocardia pulmonis]MCM6786919.1 DoxX family protein [Nocardia sp. CDC159]